MSIEEKDFYELKAITESNTHAIENIVKLVGKTSTDIDKLVETQNKILISQTQIELVNVNVKNNTEDIKELKDNLKWTVRSLIGSFITLISSVIIVFISTK